MTGRELVALELVEIKKYIEGIKKKEDRFYLGLEQISSVKPFRSPRVIKFPVYSYMVVPWKESTYLATLETADIYLSIEYQAKVTGNSVAIKVKRIQRLYGERFESIYGS